MNPTQRKLSTATMIGNGSAGFRLRWISTQQPRSQRRCLRIPARCSADLTAQSAMIGLTPLASKSDVKRAPCIEDVFKGDDFPEKDKAFRDIKSAYETMTLSYRAWRLSFPPDSLAVH